MQCGSGGVGLTDKKMTTKQYLKNVRYLDNDLQSKLRERQQLQSSFLKATSPDMDRVQETQRRHDDKYMDLMELSYEIDDYIKELSELKRDVSRRIDRIHDGLCKAILRDYYLCNFSWETVAEMNKQSVRNIHRLHGEALKLFEETI